jgi:hypothetical protein
VNFQGQSQIKILERQEAGQLLGVIPQKSESRVFQQQSGFPVRAGSEMIIRNEI